MNTLGDALADVICAYFVFNIAHPKPICTYFLQHLDGSNVKSHFKNAGSKVIFTWLGQRSFLNGWVKGHFSWLGQLSFLNGWVKGRFKMVSSKVILNG